MRARAKRNDKFAITVHYLPWEAPIMRAHAKESWLAFLVAGRRRVTINRQIGGWS
jgi:hypothetical protein